MGRLAGNRGDIKMNGLNLISFLAGFAAGLVISVITDMVVDTLPRRNFEKKEKKLKDKIYNNKKS